MNGPLRFLYILLVGGAVLGVVITGTKALYPPKEYTQSCTQEVAGRDASLIEKAKNLLSGRQDYSECQRRRDAEEQNHKRVVAIIAMVAAALCTLAALIYRRLAVIADGLSLGAIMTAIYGMRLSSKAGGNMLVFISTLLLLIITILVAYRKYSSPKPPAPAQD